MTFNLLPHFLCLIKYSKQLDCCTLYFVLTMTYLILIYLCTDSAKTLSSFSEAQQLKHKARVPVNHSGHRRGANR